jgi:hypothetical protein
MVFQIGGGGVDTYVLDRYRSILELKRLTLSSQCRNFLS